LAKFVKPNLQVTLPMVSVALVVVENADDDVTFTVTVLLPAALMYQLNEQQIGG
jgi:hypothetical protein